MTNRANLAGTINGRHVWTTLEMEHAMVLRQYGQLENKDIAEKLNAYFATTKSTRTVQNALDTAAGTLPDAEVMKRKEHRQPDASPLWLSISALGPDAFTVKMVLFEHGLIEQAEWEHKTFSLVIELVAEAERNHVG